MKYFESKICRRSSRNSCFWLRFAKYFTTRKLSTVFGSVYRTYRNVSMTFVFGGLVSPAFQRATSAESISISRPVSRKLYRVTDPTKVADVLIANFYQSDRFSISIKKRKRKRKNREESAIGLFLVEPMRF